MLSYVGVGGSLGPNLEELIRDEIQIRDDDRIHRLIAGLRLHQHREHVLLFVWVRFVQQPRVDDATLRARPYELKVADGAGQSAGTHERLDSESPGI